MRYPALVPDALEWDEYPGETHWAVIVPADAVRLPGLAKAREVLEQLPVVLHPDHYLHCTLRELGPAASVDDATIDAIGDAIASESPWTAAIRGLYAWPTAVWADPDPDGRMQPLLQKILGSIGNIGEHRYHRTPKWHLTLGYSQGNMSASDVGRALRPYEDLEIGTIDASAAVLAELHFTEPYPHWRVLRRFPFLG